MENQEHLDAHQSLCDISARPFRVPNVALPPWPEMHSKLTALLITCIL